MSSPEQLLSFLESRRVTVLRQGNGVQLLYGFNPTRESFGATIKAAAESAMRKEQAAVAAKRSRNRKVDWP